MRRAAAAGHDVVAAVRDAAVLVALDPVIHRWSCPAMIMRTWCFRKSGV
jgi:uncharacterized protein YbjT (DUF2867 family)